jgi:glycerophosphoryl diester phosphodiesterase
VDEAFVTTAHRLGLQVHVWTINEEAEMRRLLDLGVDALVTDEARLLRDVLAQVRG